MMVNACNRSEGSGGRTAGAGLGRKKFMTQVVLASVPQMDPFGANHIVLLSNPTMLLL